MSIIYAFIFLLGFGVGTLVICLLFVLIIAHASHGNKELQLAQKAAAASNVEANAAARAFWIESNRQQQLQTDALTIIAESLKAESPTAPKNIIKTVLEKIYEHIK